MKKWYESKTIWTNIVAIVTALSTYFTEAADLNTTVVAIVMAVVNIVLRFLTQRPIE